MEQRIIAGADCHKRVGELLDELGSKRFMLVCDSSFDFLSIKEYFLTLGDRSVPFDRFTPNPLYEDVCKGVELFVEEGCDAIVAVGGGSSIDVAKCIKLYAKMDHSRNYLEQECFDSGIPLIALPTTAGTGSESTRFAVIYYDGKKQSIAHPSIVPDIAVLDHGVLATLPIYQKKCTMLDALCQGIESMWSVNSTDESMDYARKAIKGIIANGGEYINNGTAESAMQIMLAANYAGRAINITQTTAAHAMSYKLTSMYGIPHGHAVAVCIVPLWRFMAENTGLCIDKRGEDHLCRVFDEVTSLLGCKDYNETGDRLENMLLALGIKSPAIRGEDISTLAGSVNTVRLSNNPVRLTDESLRQLYVDIQKGARA